MIPPKWNKGNYHAVPQEGHDHQFDQQPSKGIHNGIDEELVISSFPPRLRQNILRSGVHWAAHFLLSFLLLLSIITPGFRGFSGDRTRGHIIRPAEEFYQDIKNLSQTELSYLGEKSHFDKEQDKWKGHPNRENDRLWQTLGDLGVVSITEVEARYLGVRTARNIGAPDEFVIAPLVYHELHCLSMYRDLLWKAVDGTLIIDVEMQEHHDHCINTLRQSLTCNANLSPINLIWKDYKIDYFTAWSAPMQCRNWDKIQEWASARNTSGMHTTIRADPEKTKERIEKLKAVGAKMPWEYLF